MARITHVKAAQQRYRTIPVLDEQGQPTYRTVNLAKPSKRGKTSYQQKVTVEDRDQPLPPEKCGFCHQDIQVGTPYKHVTVKRAYGGTRYVRHEACPTWQPWELSDSLSARVQQIQADIDQDDLDSIRSAVDDIRGLAEEKNAAADSLEEGFGHETYQSTEIREQADALDEWADEIEAAVDDAENLDHNDEDTRYDEDTEDEVFPCSCGEEFEDETDRQTHQEDERTEAIGTAYDLTQESPV